LSTDLVGLTCNKKTVNQPATTRNTAKWPAILFSAVLLIAFFLPWVVWDQTRLAGVDMPRGHFFSVSEQNFRLANPFPQFNFAITGLWLIPILAVMTIVLAFLNKKTSFFSALTGFLALSMVTIYILFSEVLKDLGVQYSLQIGLYITILAAGGIILAGSQGWLQKIVLFLSGPALVWIGFSVASRYLENEEFADTANTRTDYTVTATKLIKEFQTNDSLANAKYREKIIAVNGNISEIEKLNDSTVNIKFIDTTTGSYAIFPFTGENVKDVAELKKGDPVSLKGSCSGGVLSEILGTESITFKRCILNKK
jgi:hypothetical protein